MNKYAKRLERKSYIKHSKKLLDGLLYALLSLALKVKKNFKNSINQHLIKSKSMNLT